ncbi:MAG: hypothetical protein HZB33_06280 [Nitrospirae bacterium]|nr:hypothetical protein [Nitrospirota bacterium]
MGECKKNDEGLWKLNGTAMNIYSSLVSLRNQELSNHWTRYHVFAALNSAVIVAFVNFSGPRGGDNILFWLGIFLTIVWFLFTHYGKEQIIERWDKKLETFEEEVSKECGFHAFFSELRRKRGFIHWLQLSVPIIFLIIWCVHVHWRPDTERKIKAEESISKSIDDLKQEMAILHKSIDSQGEAVRQLNSTLAAQVSSGTIKK